MRGLAVVLLVVLIAGLGLLALLGAGSVSDTVSDMTGTNAVREASRLAEGERERTRQAQLKSDTELATLKTELAIAQEATDRLRLQVQELEAYAAILEAEGEKYLLERTGDALLAPAAAAARTVDSVTRSASAEEAQEIRSEVYGDLLRGLCMVAGVTVALLPAGLVLALKLRDVLARNKRTYKGGTKWLKA